MAGEVWELMEPLHRRSWLESLLDPTSDEEIPSAHRDLWHISKNVVIDLRHGNRREEKSIRAYEKLYYMDRSIKHMKIIRKDGRVLDLPENGAGESL